MAKNKKIVGQQGKNQNSKNTNQKNTNNNISEEERRIRKLEAALEKAKKDAEKEKEAKLAAEKAKEEKQKAKDDAKKAKEEAKKTKAETKKMKKSVRDMNNFEGDLADEVSKMIDKEEKSTNTKVKKVKKSVKSNKPSNPELEKKLKDIRENAEREIKEKVKKLKAELDNELSKNKNEIEEETKKINTSKEEELFDAKKRLFADVKKFENMVKSKVADPVELARLKEVADNSRKNLLNLQNEIQNKIQSIEDRNNGKSKSEKEKYTVDRLDAKSSILALQYKDEYNAKLADLIERAKAPKEDVVFNAKERKRKIAEFEKFSDECKAKRKKMLKKIDEEHKNDKDYYQYAVKDGERDKDGFIIVPGKRKTKRDLYEDAIDKEINDEFNAKADVIYKECSKHLETEKECKETLKGLKKEQKLAMKEYHRKIDALNKETEREAKANKIDPNKIGKEKKEKLSTIDVKIENSGSKSITSKKKEKKEENKKPGLFSKIKKYFVDKKSERKTNKLKEDFSKQYTGVMTELKNEGINDLLAGMTQNDKDILNKDIKNLNNGDMNNNSSKEEKLLK